MPCSAMVTFGTMRFRKVQGRLVLRTRQTVFSSSPNWELHREDLVTRNVPSGVENGQVVLGRTRLLTWHYPELRPS